MKNLGGNDVRNIMKRTPQNTQKGQTSEPTMKDVAKEAGVALGTVSKVVNGLPVGESYRIRVENAIQKLNYQVNSYAQGLRADKTHTVVLLIPNTEEPFYASLAYHINLTLLKQNYRMLLCSTDYDSNSEQEYIAMAQQNKVDGIIGLTYNPNLVISKAFPSCHLTAASALKSLVYPAIILPEDSLQPKSCPISAAEMSPSCAKDPLSVTSQTSARLALKTAVSPAVCTMK